MNLKNKKIFVMLTVSLFVLVNVFVMADFAVSSRSDYSSLDVIYRKAEPDPLRTGEYANVWVKVRNKGRSKARNVTLEFVPEYPFSVDPDADTTRNFGDIDPGDEYHARYKVRVDENAVTGENDLKFRTSTEIATITRELPVEVRSRESVLSVENVQIDDDKIPPSQTRDVTFTFRNRADIYMRNIDVSLGLRPAGSGELEMDPTAQMLGTADFDEIEEIPLITVGSTTQKSIGRIAPGEEKEVSFPIRAESDADEEAYKVPIGLKYEDEMGRQWQKIEYTGITVGGEPILETGFANINDHPLQDTTRDVSIRLVNRGLSEAKFLEIELLPHESYEVLGEPDVYIGHMQPDDYDSPTFTMHIEPGHDYVEIPIELDYRDSEGNTIVENRTVTFRTYTQRELDRFQLEEDGRGVFYVILIVVIVAAVYFYRKKNKKKKKMLLEEEE